MDWLAKSRKGKIDMNAKMAKWAWRAAMAGLAAGLAAAGGCATARPAAPPPPPPVVQVRPVEAPPPVAERPREGRRAMPKATEKTRELRVRFRAVAPGAGVLAQALTARVEGTLLDAGYLLERDGEADVEAVASVRAKERNARGSRTAWSADADVAVSQAARGAGGDSEKVARSWMDVRGGTARGTDDAQKRLAERLANEIAPFTGEAVRRVGENLRRVEVTVQHAWTGEAEANRYPATFIKTVGRMRGVYRCKVLSMDERKGMCAEVLYDARAFPEGFVNRLKTEPGLGLEK